METFHIRNLIYNQKLNSLQIRVFVQPKTGSYSSPMVYNYLINKNSNKAKIQKTPLLLGSLLYHFIYTKKRILLYSSPMVTSVCAYITTATRVGHTDKTCNRGTMSKEASCQITDLLCQSDTIEFLLYTGEDDLIKKFKKKKKF